MELLYSNILPLRLSEGQRTIADCFIEQFGKADRVEIAVGYVSYAALCELEKLAENNPVSNVCQVETRRSTGNIQIPMLKYKLKFFY